MNPVETIEEFCKSHRISRGTFYNLQKAGIAPRVMRVGKRVMISAEAAADWRRARENASSCGEAA